MSVEVAFEKGHGQRDYVLIHKKDFVSFAAEKSLQQINDRKQYIGSAKNYHKKTIFLKGFSNKIVKMRHILRQKS